jgi:hypothetical protein
VQQDSFCNDIAAALPNFCSLTYCDPVVSTNVECLVNLLDLDTFTVELELYVCADPVALNFTVLDQDTGLKFHEEVSSSVNLPIPGLSVDIPDVGNAGVFIAIDLGTEPDVLDISVGIDACVGILFYQLCEPNVSEKT